MISIRFRRFVASLVEADGFGAGSAAWDAQRDPLGLQGVTEPVGVVASVSQKPLGAGQAVQESGSADVVADLTRCHEEADGPSVRIGHGVKLGVHAAFRASDQSPETPFFTRRLEAVRCAFR